MGKRKKKRFITYKIYWEKLKKDNPDILEDELFELYKKNVTSKSKIDYYLARNDLNEKKAREDFENWKSRPKVNSKTWYIEKYGEIDGLNKYQDFIKKCSFHGTLEGFIDLYGESEGKQRYEEIKSKQSFGHTLDGYIEKYGKIDGPKKYSEWVKKFSHSHTLSGYIEKYGKIEGTRLYNQVQTNKSFSLSLEGFKERYGEIEGSERYSSWVENSRLTLEKFTELYGENDGPIKYYEFQNLRLSNSMKSQSRASKISLELFSNISKEFPENCFLYGDGNEKKITGVSKDGKYKTYFLDFYDPKTRLGIEFFGDYWHKYPGSSVTDDIPIEELVYQFDKDLERLQIIQSSEEIWGDVEVVWESDYKDHKEEIINRLVNLIKDRKEWKHRFKNSSMD